MAQIWVSPSINKTVHNFRKKWFVAKETGEFVSKKFDKGFILCNAVQTV
jgi:hypothetical protein